MCVPCSANKCRIRESDLQAKGRLKAFLHAQISLNQLFGKLVATAFGHAMAAFDQNEMIGEQVDQVQLLLTDNIQWQPARHPLQTLGQMEGYSHQASLFYADTHAQAALKPLLDALHQSLTPRFSDGLLLGMSLAADNIICLRALANEAEILTHLLAEAAALIQTEAA